MPLECVSVCAKRRLGAGPVQRASAGECGVWGTLGGEPSEIVIMERVIQRVVNQAFITGAKSNLKNPLVYAVVGYSASPREVEGLLGEVR